MASLMVKAQDLSVGDVLLLPMGKTATITRVDPVGPRTRYVKFRTEYGASRVEVDTELWVRPQAL